jgi:hypothetical protein
MRAEEGDESVRDYAVEGKKTHDRIKETQRTGNPVGRIFHRLTQVIRGR